MSELVIGPSTGWLYAQEMHSLQAQANFLKQAGANAVEICLAGWDVNDPRMLSLKDASAFGQGFVWSVHLPDIGEDDIYGKLKIVREALRLSGAKIALTHPLKVDGRYPIPAYRIMVAGGIPLVVENMDRDKDSGFLTRELIDLVRAVRCGFVLDVQHAFERDPTMTYARELFQYLRGYLIHLHVSGECEGDRHCLVHKATNARQIVAFLGQVLSAKRVPLILEGRYEGPEELQREIEFLKGELSL